MTITLYHCPKTRSMRVLWLLHEMGLPHEVKRVPLDRKYLHSEEYKSLKLKNDWGGAVKVGDHVYADNGATFVALDFKTGDMTTRARMIGECGVGYAEGHLYLQNPDGVVALVEAKPDALTEKSRFTQPEAEGKKGYAVPTIANGRLYLRALDTLVAYDIKKP